MKLQVLLQALTTLKTLIFLDLGHLFRRASSSVVLLVLALILLGFVLTLGFFHQMVSVYAPFHGISNPKYGLGGYEPLLFYLCVLVSLVFATRLPKYLDDTLESVVVTYRPPSNLLLSLSRVLTPTLLVALFLVLISLGYQGVASFTQFTFMEPIEPWSLVVVLINLTMAMFFWTSLAVLIAQIFKSGSIGFIGSAIILMVQAIVSPLLPWDLGSFTFGYSAANLFVSDIAPDYFQVKHFVYWISVLCISVALVTQSSALLGRTDQSKRTIYVPVVASLTLVCLMCQAFVHINTITEANQRKAWTQAYKEASQERANRLRVTAIQGSVRLAPGADLEIDLTYTFNLEDATPQHSLNNSVVRSTLALNPGMQVEHISCSGTNLSYVHENGILELDLAQCDSSSNDGYVVSFKAFGRPVPHYLVDHTLNSLQQRINPELVRLMGQRSSVFTSDYVALTPLSHWYPQPVRPTSTLQSKYVTGPIDVNIAVELNRKLWTLLTSRGELFTSETSNGMGFSVRGKFRSLGLIASEFHVEQHTFDGLQINVLVHQRHAHRFEGEDWPIAGLVRYVNQATSQLQSHGITYPYSNFSIVEIPTTFSLLNGERGTDLQMDSILMYRESEAPFSRFSQYVEWLERTYPDELASMQEFLDFLIRSYWTNSIFGQTYEDSVINGVLSGYKQVQDNQSQQTKLILEQLLLSLIDKEDGMPNYRFDFAIANTLSRESQLNMRYIARRLRGIVEYFNLRNFQETHLNSHAFWESIEESFSPAQTEGVLYAPRESEQHTREQRLRVHKLVEMIEASLDQETIASTVARVHAKAKSQPIDLKMISAEFQSSELAIQPMIESTLLSHKLPGVIFSVLRQASLDEPDDYGFNYVSTIDIRSGEDVAAYVWLQAAEFEPVLIEDTTFDVWSTTNTLGPLEFPGESSNTLVMRTKNRIGELNANTFLSLNRGQLQIPIQEVDVLPSVDLASTGDGEWYSLVSSDWNPDGDKNTIYVDDLDSGFEAPNSANPYGETWLTARSRLFRSYDPIESGLDNGLPISTYAATHRGTWSRTSYDPCWGRYRHTYVLGDTSKKTKQEISFNTELSQDGRWMLSYHFPSTYGITGDYDFRVTVGRQKWDISVKHSDWHEGWNELGTFQTEEPGYARVSLSNESSAPFVAADAIKWTYLDSD